MAAVARSVGIPIRVAGCSQSILDDDHHWTEFYDDKSASGPFGDSWHTKEGVSKGNEGGPWDAPSTCDPLRYTARTRITTLHH